jgi:hypothetical protein
MCASVGCVKNDETKISSKWISKTDLEISKDICGILSGVISGKRIYPHSMTISPGFHLFPPAGLLSDDWTLNEIMGPFSLFVSSSFFPLFVLLFLLVCRGNHRSH